MKGPVQSILVPVDFSLDASYAVQYANRLANLQKATLIILHVVHDPGEAPGFYAKRRKTKSLRKMEDTAAIAMDDFLSDISKNIKNASPLKKAERLLVSGLPAPRILEVAENRKVSQIVMGSKGRTGLAHLLIGSKAEQVVRLAKVPVTILKEPFL